MKIKLLLFGITKDIFGDNQYEMDVTEDMTVGQLRSQLVDDHPKLGKLRSLLIAVNSEYGIDEQRIGPSDEIALIPPVSGG